MASRKGPKGAGGGSASPGTKRETKHGGNKNGKKESLSGSSFFTWFMVIALLGVWTSVAVVWFELVDYEEVLGKLGIYDADGDGDFDVEDAKVLLGLKERSVPAQTTSSDSEDPSQPAEPFVETEHKNAEIELEEEIHSVLHEALHLQSGERHEDVHESIHDRWRARGDIHDEAFETPAADDLHGELENEIPEQYELPDSNQKDTDVLADDLGAVDPETYEVPVSYEYDMGGENTEREPEAPGDTELELENAIEHLTAVEATPEELYEVVEPVSTAEEVIEVLEINEEPAESKPPEDRVAGEPEESELPVEVEDYSNDNLVDT